ncbi:sulfatase-like hydrolase/transferase, partial [Desulfosarcina sp.]|uniref:sulfatase-like hydrolase/transferase n=1 Tax=Desulfosarcina sp. TaxID=2027861 RepID=UPI0029A5276A
MSILFAKTAYLFPASTVLIISVLVQGIIAFRYAGNYGIDPHLLNFRQDSANTGIFLFLLFMIGAFVSLIEPSWHRLADLIVLDSKWDAFLRYVFPSLLSGTINVWVGIGMLIVVAGFRHLCKSSDVAEKFRWAPYFLVFFALIAAFTAFLFVTLYHAIAWQIDQLYLRTTIWQLIVFFSVSGGFLLTRVFFRLTPHLPRPQHSSMISVVSLTMGATLIFPLTWLFSLRSASKTSWVLISTAALGACVAGGYLMLFGDIFNPWFTAFSYLKGAIIKIVSVALAGIVALLIEQRLHRRIDAPFRFRRQGVALAIVACLGFLPFLGLAAKPEIKAAVLQFNELTRVDTTFARAFARVLRLDQWIQLGQRPPQNQHPHPWPQPWKLKKTQPSRLPEDFNLLIIVADALRGDAFHSAGYHRNLTPFLDRWAREEAISFRRAYSQGGGSFAAFPLLVAGRSRFTLYGPGLHRENLYYKIAQAEGIQHYMLMKGFGPRHLYPPDLPVTELAIPRAVSDRQSATADEVFDAARNAIRGLPGGERFLCFLQLMDVHNDLWKKEDGLDFGDSPRDLYDNNLSYIDRAFARFVAWLKHEGIYDRTVILFTADHGEQFWEHGASLHGHTVYEEEIRIPLILATHNLQKRFEAVPVIAADIVPTLADLAGYTVDPPYDDPRMGISLLPLILDNKQQPYLNRDVAGRASFKRRYFLYRNWEWKLVYFAEFDLLQLFNVTNDPEEKINLLTEEPAL